MGGQSPTFLKWAVEGMVISIAFLTNFLCWDRQCQMWEVDLPPIVGRLDAPVFIASFIKDRLLPSATLSKSLTFAYFLVFFSTDHVVQ